MVHASTAVLSSTTGICALCISLFARKRHWFTPNTFLFMSLDHFSLVGRSFFFFPRYRIQLFTLRTALPRSSGSVEKLLLGKLFKSTIKKGAQFNWNKKFWYERESIGEWGGLLSVPELILLLLRRRGINLIFFWAMYINGERLAKLGGYYARFQDAERLSLPTVLSSISHDSQSPVSRFSPSYGLCFT